jgi:hypothetical protein
MAARADEADRADRASHLTGGVTVSPVLPVNAYLGFNPDCNVRTATTTKCRKALLCTSSVVTPVVHHLSPRSEHGMQLVCSTLCSLVRRLFICLGSLVRLSWLPLYIPLV